LPISLETNFTYFLTVSTDITILIYVGTGANVRDPKEGLEAGSSKNSAEVCKWTPRKTKYGIE